MSDKHTTEVETRDARYPWLLAGEVTENVDPEGLGRVKVHVPGLLEPQSVWAFPCGRMFGVKEGLHWVPRKGVNGVIWLNQGDVDHPYFMPGPAGKPAGSSDVPDQSAGGDVDVVVFRWAQFHAIVDGRQGAEKLELVDEVSSTSFMVDRTTGDFTRTVTGPTGRETATVKGDQATTVQQGNLTTTVSVGDETRTIAAGSRTTTIGAAETEAVGADKTKTVAGSETDTITGAKTETIGGIETKTVAGASLETIGAAKTLTAAAAIAITAGAAMALTAAGALTAIANAVTLQSSGPSTSISGGIQTNTFLGGILENVTGVIVRVVSGAVTETVNGLWTMVCTGGLILQGTPIVIGNPIGASKLLLEAFATTLLPLHRHTCSAPGSPSSGIVDWVGTGSPPPSLVGYETTDLTAS